MTTGPGLDEATFAAWLDSLPVTDEPPLICPSPDVHRGLYLASEDTWRRPAAERRAAMSGPYCPHCGKPVYKGGQP